MCVGLSVSRAAIMELSLMDNAASLKDSFGSHCDGRIVGAQNGVIAPFGAEPNRSSPKRCVAMAFDRLWKPFVRPAITAGEEAFLAKLMSLIVKLGALLVILFVPTKFAIDFQLLGGVWMIQCFPAIIFGLYTRWFSGWALLGGWAVGMVVGTYLAWTPGAWVPVHSVFDWFVAYNGLIAVTLNVAVSTLVSLAVRSNAPDATIPDDYLGGRAVQA